MVETRMELTPEKITDAWVNGDLIHSRECCGCRFDDGRQKRTCKFHSDALTAARADERERCSAEYRAAIRALNCATDTEIDAAIRALLL